MKNNDNSKKLNSNNNANNNSEKNQNQQPNLQLTGQSEINATLQMVINQLQNIGAAPPDEGANGQEDNGNTGDDGDNEGDGGTDSPQLPLRIPPRAELETFFTCVDLLIFELDDDVIEKLILCALFSMSLDKFISEFRKVFFPLSVFNTVVGDGLRQKVESKAKDVYNNFVINLMNNFQSADNKKEYLTEFIQSNKLCSCNSSDKKFADILSGNIQNILDNDAQAPNSQLITDQLEEIIRASVITFFFNNFTFKFLEFQRSAGFKVLCIKKDLLFLSEEIQRLTSVEAGIFILAQALETVTSSRFAEDDEFDEVFDSVEELADVIEELAEIYQDRLKVFRALLPFAKCEEQLNIPLGGDIDFDGISDVIIGDTLNQDIKE